MSRYNGPATLLAALLAGALLSTVLGASRPAQADRKSDEARALERIARVLEERCKP